MNIDQYIRDERQRAKKLQSSEGKRYILQSVQERGFYSVPMEYYTQGKQDVAVIMHIGTVAQGEKAFFPHNHDYFELMFVYEGSCINLFKDHKIHMGKGDVLLLNPDAFHDPYTSSEDDIIFNIMLSKNFFEESLLSLLVGNRLMGDFFANYLYQINRTQDYIYFPNQNDYYVQETIKGIIFEYINKEPFYLKIIESSLTMLFGLLTRIYAKQNDLDLKSNHKAAVLPEILAYIEKHCTDVTLTQLQEQFSYSVTYLSRMIKKYTGKSFSEIVHNFKLQRVKNLLVTTNLSVSEITYRCGFSNNSYLNQVFKQKYNMTLSEYRRGMIG